jgi:hypothetical protein
MNTVACDDNSTLGLVEGSTVFIYSLVGEVDFREGESVYTLLHSVGEPDCRARFYGDFPRQ